jgi:putative phage-type endonuclease
MDRIQFLLERRSGIGGSDIAAIAGENPHRKSIQVYLEKIGMSDPFEENVRMRVGTYTEPLNMELLAEKAGNRLRYFAQNGHAPEHPLIEVVSQRLFVHPEDSILRCHPDGFILNADGDPIGVVECKSAGIRQSAFYGEEGSDEMPTMYLMQIQFGQGVCGAELNKELRIGHLPLIIDNDWKFYQTEFSPSLFASMRKIADDFWNEHVVKLIPPEPDNSEQYATYLKSTFRDAGTEIVATPEIEELMMQFQLTKKSLEGIEALECEQKNRLQAFLGDNSVLRGQRFMMTWKADKPSFVIDYKAICDHLHLPEDFIVTFTHQKKEVRRLLGPRAVK